MSVFRSYHSTLAARLASNRLLGMLVAEDFWLVLGEIRQPSSLSLLQVTLT